MGDRSVIAVCLIVSETPATLDSKLWGSHEPTSLEDVLTVVVVRDDGTVLVLLASIDNAVFEDETVLVLPVSIDEVVVMMTYLPGGKVVVEGFTFSRTGKFLVAGMGGESEIAEVEPTFEANVVDPSVDPWRTNKWVCIHDQESQWFVFHESFESRSLHNL